MRRLSLRLRIISALVLLAAGTSAAVSGLTTYFLSRTPQVSTNPELGRALQNALDLAKRDYGARKARLLTLGDRWAEDSRIISAYENNDIAEVNDLILQRVPGLVARFAPSTAALTRGKPAVGRTDGDHTALRLTIPLRRDGRAVGTLLIDDPLDELLNIEQALHTFEHLEMIVADMREGLFLSYVVIGAVTVVLALLIGLRIGLGITHPLSTLIRGTRELARDNLDYRIPAGPQDEIGLLIDSFNHMATDLQENRRQRVEAEKVAAWREIARRLAHEIKNPLTPIQLTVQQMRDKYTGQDDAYAELLDDCTEIVTEEVESLRLLVQEFAEFARMPKLALMPHDVNAAVRDTLRLYPDNQVRLDLDDSAPQLQLDPEGFRRVLINLVENAFDAAGEKSEVTIRTRLEDQHVVLDIIDAGPGVANQDRERIFEPYVSLKEDGTGLGLAVVRSIVEEHGGTIAVTDSPTGGAQFQVRLPARHTTGRRR
jgi:nitrogen fixation/metabolism regulation signal transduction histidine kinase